MLMKSFLRAVIIAACLLFGESAIAEDARVLLICGDQHESTLRTIKGIKQGIKGCGITAQIEIITATPSENERETLDRQKSEFAPDVVVTVGSRSTRLAKTLIDDTPIVFASVLNPVTSGFVASYDLPGDMLTGASLDIAVDIQLEKFRQLVPSIRKIGVLHR
jgi:putative ABC transport system substrate-binding protein